MDEKDIEKDFLNAWEEEPEKQAREDKEASWEAFAGQAFPVKQKPVRKWMHVAAALIVSIGIISVLTFKDTITGEATLAYNIVENPTSVIKVVSLPDSSVVELEPAARIEYRNDFSVNRKVMLNGRAFFKVRKDKLHPFRVSCGETTTTVLGTSFTISECDKNSVCVNLYEGSVQMNIKNSTANWILSPGEQFIYNKNTVKVEAFNRFKDFNNEPMSAVAQYIKVNYGYEIKLPEEYLTKQITLRLNKKEELDDIVAIIAQMYNLTPSVNAEVKIITFQ